MLQPWPDPNFYVVKQHKVAHSCWVEGKLYEQEKSQNELTSHCLTTAGKKPKVSSIAQIHSLWKPIRCVHHWSDLYVRSAKMKPIDQFVVWHKAWKRTE